MNNEKNKGKRIKELLARKTLPTVLAGTMLFGSGALLGEANAYSLDEPIQGYEDFINYNGVKVFINGRYVEFNESTGYPFVLDGSTMIPLRAVSEAFGAKVEWNSYSKTASVSKYDTSVDVTVDSKEMKVKNLNDNSISTSSVTKEALIKDGRTYIPLRSLFECFGLSVRWDNQKQIAHIETVSLESLENIDFKEEKVYTINELIDMKDIKSIEYDGEKIDKEYLGVLSESNQYVVIVKDNNAKVFSYQFLSNLNYYYDKLNFIINKSNYKVTGDVYLRDESEENIEFFRQLMWFNIQLNYISFHKSENYVSPTYFKLQKVQYDELMQKVKKIGDEIKDKVSNKKEQAVLLNKYLSNNIGYDMNYSFCGSYDALINRKAVCAGYSMAFNLIADYLSIPSIYVTGNFKNYPDGHAWNEVYLDGEWYIFDATNGYELRDINDKDYSCNEENDLKKTQQYIEDKELVKLTYKF